MSGPLSFPADTLDQIETKWWPEIRKKYPEYGPFWEAFIGVRKKNGILTPYGLVFCSKTTPEQPVLDAYEHLVIAHYSMFCELTAAHVALARARSADAGAGSDADLSSFLEAFNGFYDHLGTARNMFFRMWGCMKDMQVALGLGQSKTPNPIPCPTCGRPKPSGDLEHRFAKMGETGLASELALIEQNVVSIRNNHVHAFNSAFVVLRGHYFVQWPVRTDPAPAWRVPLSANWIGACTKMSADLDQVEGFFNTAERILSREISQTFKQGGIRVNY